jgi:hypothetical protein
MDKHIVLKCDCGGHLLEISYDKEKNTWEDISFVIYDLYNPKTGRKYRKPKMIADVLIADYHWNELTELFSFFKSIMSLKRQKLDVLSISNYHDKHLDKCIEIVKKNHEKLVKENAERLKKNKKNS